MGIPSPKGTGRWGTSTVSRLLRNPAYTGKTYAFRYLSVEPKKPGSTNRRYSKIARQERPVEEWIEVPDATPPIISEEVFKLAQEQLKRNMLKASRNQKYQYLLVGHIKCGICGRSWSSHAEGNGYRYYRCYGKRKTVMLPPCTSKAVPATQLEDLVWDKVKEVLIHPELILNELRRRQKKAQNSETVVDEIKILDKRLERTDRSIQRLVTLFHLGEIDDEYIINENKKLKDRKKGLQEERDILHKRLELRTISDAQIEALQEYCKRAASNIEGFTFEEKRLAIESLDIKAIVKPEGIVIQGAVPVTEPSFAFPSCPC